MTNTVDFRSKEAQSDRVAPVDVADTAGSRNTAERVQNAKPVNAEELTQLAKGEALTGEQTLAPEVSDRKVVTGELGAEAIFVTISSHGQVLGDLRNQRVKRVADGQPA